MKVCLASSRLLWSPALGGHAWVNLNWALGLAANGVEVTFLESLPDGLEPQAAAQRVAAFRSQLEDLGLAAQISLLPPARPHEPSAEVQQTVPFERVVAETDLLFNFNYGLEPAAVARFARSLLVDIDPGLLQMWVSGGAFTLPAHDLYFTIGETVGRSEARFSDCGLRWHYTPPPVHLPSWPPMRAAAGAPFTTVTNWWAAFEVDRGEVFNNEKRTSFMECLDLPWHTEAALELAIYHEDGNWSEFSLLRDHGWRARPAYEVSATPQAYRAYIQGSRGEFSCAKPSCMRFQNAWISDRTLCYLASGKPCVVQHTGSSRFLPDAAGLFRFRSMAEAACQLATVTEDYEHQCERLARALAAEHFDAERIVAGVLAKSAP